MEVVIQQMGPIAQNCYILTFDDDSAVIIDPGYYPDVLAAKIASLGVSPKGILITHGHPDHIGAMAALRERYDIPVYCTVEDADRLPVQPDVYIKDGDEITVGGGVFTVVATPGHTPGGVCYIIEDKIFTGDTLFRRSVGRTDYPGGDYDVFQVSLRKLVDLPQEELRVYPGHDELTWLSQERKYNPFLPKSK